MVDLLSEVLGRQAKLIQNAVKRAGLEFVADVGHHCVLRAVLQLGVASLAALGAKKGADIPPAAEPLDLPDDLAIECPSS